MPEPEPTRHLGQAHQVAAQQLVERGDCGHRGYSRRAAEQLPDRAHAIEAQAIELLSKGAEIAGQDDLSGVFREHLQETHEHQQLIDERLQARGASSSKIKDAALRLGALNWGGFFGAQPDAPAKLAGFAYAFEHLEIGAYELLRRVARRAADSETEAVAERILNDERTAADKLHALFDAAVDAALRDQEVAAS
jgi:ferritin-like metal-binding protein YciE